MVKDHTRGMKSIANRRFRRKKIAIANGNAYRKVVCSYDINDWMFRETYPEYRARAEMHRKEYENGIGYWRHTDFSADMSYWDWFKMYRRK